MAQVILEGINGPQINGGKLLNIEFLNRPPVTLATTMWGWGGSLGRGITPGIKNYRHNDRVMERAPLPSSLPTVS
mgnify:CR=1 FL=1